MTAGPRRIIMGTPAADQALRKWEDDRLDPPEPEEDEEEEPEEDDWYDDEPDDREATDEEYGRIDDDICRRIYGE